MSLNLAALDATAQAELVRRGDLTPLELVDAAIERIERFDPLINAVVVRLFEQARSAARSHELPAGKFRGVPFLLKDEGTSFQGLPFYMGNRALRDAAYVSPRDGALALRFRRAGLVLLGKSSVPEFATHAHTESLAFGITRNPWSLDRSASGSSGGACAAVAAGFVPIAHATDGGGSIRMPAAWCGVVGLKPSRGRIPEDRPWLAPPGVSFAVARTVRDVAGLLDEVHGNQPADPFVVAPPARPFLTEVATEPRRLRIGLLAETEGIEVTRECAAATRATGTLLASLGHEVEESWPPALFQRPSARHPGFPFIGYRWLKRELEEMLGRPLRESDVEPHSWRVFTADVPPVPTEEYLAAAEQTHEWVSRVMSWWARGFDLLLTPTVCEPPLTLDVFAAIAGSARGRGALTLKHATFTLPFNLTGQPAISLPLCWTPGGLPIGMQLVAGMGREDLLLQVAAQLERAQPWFRVLPPTFATSETART